MQRLVVDSSQIHPPIAHLSIDQCHYLRRVLRLKLGDRFIVLDGQGRSWVATLSQSDAAESSQVEFAGRAIANLLEPIVSPTELPVSITLVVALPKGNSFDDIVRQATELGVVQIAPVISDRTLLNPSPQKRDRWQRIAQEAAEQSERQQVPVILEPISFSEYLGNLAEAPFVQGYLAVTRYVAPHLLDCLLSPSLPALASLPSSPNSLSIAIGPEGGWTEMEVEAAIAVGYQPVSLGRRILRTVTAPIAALTLIAAVYERGTVER
jgi:16S rRNA (uracil1498-N3)-methyltransferase